MLGLRKNADWRVPLQPKPSVQDGLTADAGTMPFIKGGHSLDPSPAKYSTKGLPAAAVLLVDAPPAVPDAMDDEFNGTSLDPKWIWLNQGTTTVSFAFSYAILNMPTSRGYDWKGIVQKPPTPPYSFTARCSSPVGSPPAVVTAIAIGWRESATGKMALFLAENAVGEGIHYPLVDAQKWNDFATFNGAITGLHGNVFSGSANYLRIQNTGTNLNFYTSSDGAAFSLWGSDTVADAFTVGPDQVGIFGLNNDATLPVSLSCDYFRRSQ